MIDIFVIDIEGFKGIILPAQNAAEAAVIDGLKVYGAHNLREVVDLLNKIPGHISPIEKPATFKSVSATDYKTDFADVKGQNAVKRALEVADRDHTISLWSVRRAAENQ